MLFSAGSPGVSDHPRVGGEHTNRIFSFREDGLIPTIGRIIPA